MKFRLTKYQLSSLSAHNNTFLPNMCVQYFNWLVRSLRSRIFSESFKITEMKKLRFNHCNETNLNLKEKRSLFRLFIYLWQFLRLALLFLFKNPLPHVEKLYSVLQNSLEGLREAERFVHPDQERIQSLMQQLENSGGVTQNSFTSAVKLPQLFVIIVSEVSNAADVDVDSKLKSSLALCDSLQVTNFFGSFLSASPNFSTAIMPTCKRNILEAKLFRSSIYTSSSEH